MILRNMSGKKQKPLEPLIPLDDLKKVLSDLVHAPKEPIKKAEEEPKKD